MGEQRVAQLVPPQARSRLSPRKETSKTILGCLFLLNSFDSRRKGVYKKFHLIVQYSHNTMGIMNSQNNFEALTASSVNEVGTEAWDALSVGRPFQHRWYRFGETALADCPPTYIILSHGGEVVAWATFWLSAVNGCRLPRQSCGSGQSDYCNGGHCWRARRPWPVYLD